MVDNSTLEHLIDKAANAKSDWSGARINAAALAHRARVDHAAEVLVQLGHDHLAGQLLRLERRAQKPRLTTTTELPPAA